MKKTIQRTVLVITSSLVFANAWAEDISLSSSTNARLDSQAHVKHQPRSSSIDGQQTSQQKTSQNQAPISRAQFANANTRASANSQVKSHVEKTEVAKPISLSSASTRTSEHAVQASQNSTAIVTASSGEVVGSSLDFSSESAAGIIQATTVSSQTATNLAHTAGGQVASNGSSATEIIVKNSDISLAQVSDSSVSQQLTSHLNSDLDTTSLAMLEQTLMSDLSASIDQQVSAAVDAAINSAVETAVETAVESALEDAIELDI